MKRFLLTIALIAAAAFTTTVRAADCSSRKTPEPSLEQRVAGLEAYIANTDPTAPLKDKDGKIPDGLDHHRGRKPRPPVITAG